MSFNTRNPLTGADPELQEMAKYYLGPDAAPRDTEKPSVAHAVSTLSSKSSPKSTKTLKKLKRNERDRQRSLAKRENMAQMRQQVKDLEGCKQRLVNAVKRASPETPQLFSSSLSHPFSTVYPSSSHPIKRENFVRLANEIEEFRHQNAAMIKQLRQRDVATGYMQNLLLEFVQDETDSDSNSHSGSDTGKPSRKTKSFSSSPHLFNGNNSVRFTPLTHKESISCVHETLQLINNARSRYANDAVYRNCSMFLGWKQYMRRQGSTIVFSVKKSLLNVLPAELMATTWHLLTEEKNAQKLITSTVNARIRPLQKLSDDFFVIDRRTEDSARTGICGKKLALRTVYMSFRVVDADGNHTITLKTINLPYVKKLLRDDEHWYEIFYWIRFSSSSNNGDFTTFVEFGGSNTYTSDEIAQAWLSELVFLAIRWESLAGTLPLLKF